jgi:ubiquinone/menaquinone biosynthesis C-methylase UbiE
MENFKTLDVGCGCHGVGDVNVDVFREGFNRQIGNQQTGELVEPHKIKNFIVADACFLPFQSKVFEVAFSSHVIEHVKYPFLMYSEMCRVSFNSVVIRCPHRRGSGAKRPFHVNYFDEAWFKKAASALNFSSTEKITVYDWNVSSWIPVPKQFENSLVWRAFKHLERKVLSTKRGVPSEIESCINISSEIRRE